MNVLYRIRNVVNNCFYVGSTVNMKLRTDLHRRRLRKGAHQSPKLQAAWDEFGEDCFKFEALEEYASVERLREVENEWLQKWHGKPECYNASSDACAPMRGRKHTPEAKAKMALKTVHRGEAHYRYGKTLDEATRKKIGDAQRGVKKGPREISEAGRASIRAAAAAGHYSNWKGKKHTEESKAKMGKAIRETTTGTEFATLSQALVAYGLKMPTLRRALLSGKPIARGPQTGLRFEYVCATLPVP